MTPWEMAIDLVRILVKLGLSHDEAKDLLAAEYAASDVAVDAAEEAKLGGK